MKILLTGGSGLIGREFIKQAIIEKHQVIGVSRNITKAKKQLRAYYGPQVTANSKWLSSLDNLKNLDSYDAVVNLAGEPIVNKRWSLTQKQIIQNSRWLITKRLVDLFKVSNEPPKVFVSGSAIGYYGRQDHRPIDESFTNIHEEFSHQLCKKWEDIALSASNVTRVCLLRTGIVVSNKGGALAKMLPPFKLCLGGPIGDGAHFMPWIHLEDMVRGINHLIKNTDSRGPYNLTAPNPVSNKEFSKTLAAVISRPAFIPMPPVVLKALMGEMSDLLTTGQNVIPKKLLDEGFSFKFSELTSALQDLKLQ